MTEWNEKMKIEIVFFVANHNNSFMKDIVFPPIMIHLNPHCPRGTITVQSSSWKRATDPNELHQRHDSQEPFDCLKQKKTAKTAQKNSVLEDLLKVIFKPSQCKSFAKTFPVKIERSNETLKPAATVSCLRWEFQPCHAPSSNWALKQLWNSYTFYFDHVLLMPNCDTHTRCQ